MSFQNRIKSIVFSFILLFFPILLSNPCIAQLGILGGIPGYPFRILRPFNQYSGIFNSPYGMYGGINNLNPFYGGYYGSPAPYFPFSNGSLGVNGYYGVGNYGLYGIYGEYGLPTNSNNLYGGYGFGYPIGSNNTYGGYGFSFPNGSLNIYSIGRPPYTYTPVETRLTQPTGFVYCPAEYEPCAGLLIAWEKYPQVLTDLTVGITRNDPEAIMYVVVDNSLEEANVYNTLDRAGADMSQVEFIVHMTDTVWIRDYGPRFVFEDGERTIIDYTYTHIRENDNLFNDYLSNLWDEPQYQISLEHGGGNFHVFENGDAFMSTVVLERNPSYTEQDVKALFSEYKNVDVTIYPRLPSSFDLTGHIDMWMLPVDSYRVIIGEYASSAGEPRTITENVSADLMGRGYTVYRTPGWKSGNIHYTYTNSVILNDLVFIPRYGGPWSSEDAQALEVFHEAFPGHTIMQIDCSQIILENGALHCVVMNVPAYAP